MSWLFRIMWTKYLQTSRWSSWLDECTQARPTLPSWCKASLTFCSSHHARRPKRYENSLYLKSSLCWTRTVLLTEITVVTSWGSTSIEDGLIRRNFCILPSTTQRCLRSSVLPTTLCCSIVTFMGILARKTFSCTVVPALRVISISTRTTTWFVWSRISLVKETSSFHFKTANLQMKQLKSRRLVW